MEAFDRPTPLESRLHAGRFFWSSVLVLVLAIVVLGVFRRYSPNRPVDQESELDHFFYGSIGSDISGGLPLKVVQVLPTMFPEHLPRGSQQKDLTAFGFIQQPGQRMPIGFSTRRRFIDFTAINCASCHTGSVRESAGSKPIIVPAMPANTVDLLGYFKFLFDCGADPRFNARQVVAAMEEAGLIRGSLERTIYSAVVPRMREGLLDRRAKLAFMLDPKYTPFGPGRVNTFDTFKFDQFAYYYNQHGKHEIPQEELYGIVDFPSVWNQAGREGLNLHWDGNNTSVRERNFSAAIGAGTTPPHMDIPRLFRVEAWLRTLPPPEYPFAIDQAMATEGQAIYKKYCFECHDFKGDKVGKVFSLATTDIGTDRHRVDSYTQFLLEAQQDYTKGYFWSFKNFKKTDGYASQPLDGIWARAPYLHNGSVPSMWDLLTPADQRPTVFTIGGDVYDQEKMGFVHDTLTGSAGSGYFLKDGGPYEGPASKVLDTTLRGNGNQGHSGAAYGTELSDEEKQALIEFLKQLAVEMDTTKNAVER